MAWPKGKPRGPRIDRAPLRETTTERTPVKYDSLAAGANWENMSESTGVDRFHIPESEIPEGWSFLWSIEEVRGQPMPSFVATRLKQGWTPVSGQDFGGRFNGRFTAPDTGVIRMDGMVLMARPSAITAKAVAAEKRAAREPILIKEGAVRAGVDIAAMGADHPSAVATNRISRTYERLTIPEDSE
jgi:hypothetical protein